MRVFHNLMYRHKPCWSTPPVGRSSVCGILPNETFKLGFGFTGSFLNEVDEMERGWVK